MTCLHGFGRCHVLEASTVMQKPILILIIVSFSTTVLRLRLSSRLVASSSLIRYPILSQYNPRALHRLKHTNVLICPGSPPSPPKIQFPQRHYSKTLHLCMLVRCILRNYYLPSSKVGFSSSAPLCSAHAICSSTACPAHTDPYLSHLDQVHIRAGSGCGVLNFTQRA